MPSVGATVDMGTTVVASHSFTLYFSFAGLPLKRSWVNGDPLLLFLWLGAGAQT